MQVYNNKAFPHQVGAQSNCSAEILQDLHLLLAAFSIAVTRVFTVFICVSPKAQATDLDFIFREGHSCPSSNYLGTSF